MAASVRVEDDAFKDERFGVLAAEAGLADDDHARGKMLRIWRQCTAQSLHVLSEDIVRRVLGENGPDALVKSGLGERVDGGIRISGTRGRVEWLEKLKKNGRKGGKAKAKQMASNSLANAKQMASKNVARQEQEQEQEQEPSYGQGSGSSSRPELPGGDDPRVEHEQDSAVRSRKGRRSAEKPELPLPEDWGPTPEHAELAARRGVDLERELLAFRFHAQTHDRRAKVWNGAFSTWLLKATPTARYGPRAASRTGLRGAAAALHLLEVEQQAEAERDAK